ncbi:MAG: NADP-dependent malic enzyme [Candidatus Diapherotrites archaeon]|nr:NADP-dependent malic enzyme [Candidatus Diapherotrites archaeon]
MAEDYSQESLKKHKELKGKLEVNVKAHLKNAHDLSIYYTPGVAAPCLEIAQNKELAYDYTIKGSTVAIISDGSRVLGLGNIGAEAGLPVMEGKAMLLKELANVNAFPIMVKSQKAEDIIQVVENIAPSFGAINLEDIETPKAFQVWEQLQNIGIPVFHDDQQGTAITVRAALTNALKVVGKEWPNLKIVMTGAGAAGLAVAKFLSCLGHDRNVCLAPKELIIFDAKGPLNSLRMDLNPWQQELLQNIQPKNFTGTLKDAMKNADVFIGLSAPGIVSKEMIQSMNKNAIVFALANPVPEIMPEEALKAGAKIVASGRSDSINQVNNSLAFPAVFKGLLQARAKKYTKEIELVAAQALAEYVKKPDENHILPDRLDKKAVDYVAEKIAEAIQKEQLE